MTERTNILPIEAQEIEEQQDRPEVASARAMRRRSPQFEKCLEAIDALRADGTWLQNGTREEQHDQVCAWLMEKGYASNRLPSRPTFSRAALIRERDNCP